VDGLKVTRHAPGNEFVFSFPAEVEVNNVAEARSVAAATCALADFPPGSFSCPVAFAISYQLDFAVRGEEGTGGDAATLDPTGCQMVTGLGATRVPSSSFYKLLAEAMGLKHHGYRIFQGVIPKSG